VPTSLPCFLSLSKKRFHRFYQGIGEQDPECHAAVPAANR
jgi:hypothetical protein